MPWWGWLLLVSGWLAGLATAWAVVILLQTQVDDDERERWK